MATVLVVDDSPNDRRLMETVLRYQGHRVLTAGDGPEGLDLVRSEHPDLVITDILLPSMDGYELVHRLRRDPRVAGTRVIFNSAHYLEEEVRRLGLACGVEDVLVKPWEPDVLIGKVEQVLRSAPVERPGAGRAGEVPDGHAEHLRLLSAKLYEKVAELERAGEERQGLEARLRELLERMTLAQEEERRRIAVDIHDEERRRIAVDIHDDTIQVITAVGLRLQRLRARVTDEQQLGLIDEIDDTVRLAARRLRALVFDLRPPTLDFQQGLSGAIRAYLEKTPAEAPLQVEVRGEIVRPMPPETQLLLYRVAQEALINVHKHARASHVQVDVEEIGRASCRERV